MFTTYKVPPVHRSREGNEARPLVVLFSSLRRRTQRILSRSPVKAAVSKKSKSDCAAGHCRNGLTAA